MKTDVLVIGGGPGGVISAIVGRTIYPDKKFILVRKEQKSIVPCGIPYVINRLKSAEENIMGDAPLKAKEVEIVIDEVINVDRKKKVAQLASGKEIAFQKLVLATGSKPVVPSSIKGIDLENIFPIKKELNYLKHLREQIHNFKNIVIVGGGFIGVEFADEISKLPNKNISIIELSDHLLDQSFDEEFSEKVENILRKEKVNIYTQSQVGGFKGNKKVEYVLLNNGKEIPADVVILSIGSRPNTDLAEEIGLDVSPLGGIKVDEFMKTSDSDIFAVGDCVEKRCFFCRKHIDVMLASTATAEARSAGANLFHLKIIEMNKGTIGIYSTKVGDLALATAGHTEKKAIEEGYEIVTGISKGIDRHPGTLPDKHELYVKLIFSKYSGIIMGAQIYGADSVGELINTIGLAIQNKLTITDIATIQYGTHPLLTSAPTTYPLIACALDAFKKIHEF